MERILNLILKNLKSGTGLQTSPNPTVAAAADFIVGDVLTLVF
jgi:hypothetical protein